MKRLHKLLAAFFFTVALAGIAPAQVSITTWQVNNQHTGNNNQETQLTPGNVGSPGDFGLLSYPQMDGQSYGQPLLVSGIHNGNDMVFAATEHCNIYGFDVTAAGVATLAWNAPVHLVPAAVSSYVPIPSSQTGSGDISDTSSGLTTTPVIDPATSTIYVVSKLYDPSGDATKPTSYHQYLYALDLLTGNTKYGTPIEITATFPGAVGSDSVGGNITFNAYREHLRCALALDSGTLYLAYASHSDTDPYHGEVIGYSATTTPPKVVKTFNTALYNNTKSGIWAGGASPAFDTAHNLFLSVGNGDYNTAKGNWGESIVKLSTSGATVPMTVDTTSTANWFTPADWSTRLNAGDLDVGSGGVLLVPNETPSLTNNKNLVIVGGKGAILYVLDHDNLGGSFANDTGELQQINSPGDWIFATPAYYNGSVYLAAAGAALKQYKLAYNSVSTTSAYLQLQYSSTNVYNNKGATPFISSNGKTNGLVWVQNGSSVDAYDASTVTGSPIYTVNATVPTTSTNAQVAKFGVPMVANGKLFFAANDSNNKSYLFVAGLLPTAVGAPAAATGASAKALSATGTRVNWTDNSGGTAGFYIKRSTSRTSGFNTVSGTSPLSANTTTYTDTGLTASTAYYYQVVATNNAGNANASNVASATTFPTYAETGLVAYWPLEEVGLRTTADATGNGHTGTLPSGEGDLTITGGYVNYGFHAHGTGQAVSRVVVPDNAALRFTASQSFTLSAWVQPDATRGTEQTVIAKARDATTGYYGIWLDGNGHWIGRGAGGDIVSGATASPTVWTHVALVQDGTAGTRKLYVNGVLDVSGSAQAADGAGDLWMTQQNVSGAAESMPGNLDEVRLYSRALAAAEITNLLAPPVYEADSVLPDGTGSSQAALGVSIWPAATKKIEPRKGPSNAYQLVYTFATNVQSGVTSNVGTATLNASDTRQVTVVLTAANQTSTNVVLSHVLPGTAPSGAAAGTASIPFNVLLGDINADNVVNSLDASIEPHLYATAVNVGNARYDLNLDGVIDGSDTALISAASATSLGAQIDTDLALFQTATASTPTGTTGNIAALAFDTDLNNSRWESAWASDPQWIMVDLGAVCTIHQVQLKWESAAGATYTIDVSNDGANPGTQGAANWTNFATETANTGGGVKTYTGNLTGRYVRMFGTTRTLSTYGYSLYDFEVIGQSGVVAGMPSVNSAATATATTGTAFSYQITATNSPTAYNATGLPTGLSVNTGTGLISGTPTQAGSYNATVSATNATGTGSLTLAVTVQTPFAAWQGTYFTPADVSAGLSAPNATPAGDGITNLMKYALNLNPKVNGSASLPTESITSTGGSRYLTLTYTKVVAATDIMYLVEVSGDMQTWSSGSGATATVSSTTSPDGKTQAVVVRDLTAQSSAGKRFIRLKVTNP